MVTWETESDWNAADSESGVVHENTANTDHNDATVLKQGYSILNPPFSSNLLFHIPFHEDSGSTCYGFGSNIGNGTISGATLGQTSILGTTAHNYDGIDDVTTFSHIDEMSFGDSNNNGKPRTVAFWVYPEPGSIDGTRVAWIGKDNGGSSREYNVGSFSDGQLRFFLKENDDATQIAVNSQQFTTNEWQFFTLTYDGTTNNSGLTLYRNGVNVTDSRNGSISNVNYTTVDFTVADTADSDRPAEIGINHLLFYDFEMTSSEVGELYDVVSSPGSLITSEKVL